MGLFFSQINMYNVSERRRRSQLPSLYGHGWCRGEIERGKERNKLEIRHIGDGYHPIIIITFQMILLSLD